MRLRRIPEAKEYIQKNPLVFDESVALAGSWKQELHIDEEACLALEIGMGKGKFITSAADQEPDTGWLGLEFREEMIYQALLRLEDAAPDNLRFLWAKAEFLGEIFAAQEVNRLYLNFSDPWPKARHHKRRLTYQSFLDIYRYILADDGSLFFKTDNKDFFFWSKEQFLENHWLIAEEDQALPLSKAGFTTEYEDRYRRRGQPIYFLHLQKQEP